MVGEKEGGEQSSINRTFTSIIAQSMAQRIPLKTALFTHQELLARVQKWADFIDMPRFLIKNHFKYFPFFVNTLPGAFIHAALTYSIQKRLPGLVRQVQQGMVELSHTLKENYSQLNMSVLQRKDPYFYFLCVYLTKLTASFLKETFLDLDVERHLEAELFIALVHVMLGVEVCPKTYQVNLNKVVRARSPIRLLTISKCDSIQSFQPEKPSQMKINLLVPPNKRVLTKKTLERKCTQDPSRFELTQLEQFRQTLKENLAIQVLPKLPPKQIKASEFDHMTELAEAASQGDEKKYLFTTRENQVPRSPSDHLTCTQNSSSFQLLMTKNNLSHKEMHRTVKISHRPQLVPHKRGSLTPVANPLRQDLEQLERQPRCDSSRKDWDAVIKEIKQHVKINSKHTMTRNLLETAAETPQVQAEPLQDIRLDKTGRKEEIKEERPEETQPNLKEAEKRKARHFMYWINQQEGGNYKETRRENVPDSHQFRKLKRRFEGECETRQQETHYSMFNLNSTFSFFRSLIH